MSMYANPVYSLQNATGTVTGATIDVGACTNAGYPPVLIVVISATATVVVEGSHDANSWVDFSGGGFTTSVAKDLIPGVNFWRARISSYGSGTVSASVGSVPNQAGEMVTPNLKHVDYSAGL